MNQIVNLLIDCLFVKLWDIQLSSTLDGEVDESPGRRN